jgi:hypothetical protein
MICLTDRRTMLRGLGTLTVGAAASVSAIPPIAAAHPPDPSLGLVEAHAAAWARLLETEARTNDYETLEAAGASGRRRARRDYENSADDTRPRCHRTSGRMG